MQQGKQHILYILGVHRNPSAIVRGLQTFMHLVQLQERLRSTSQEHNDHNSTHHRSYSPQLYRHSETMGPKLSFEMAVKLQSMSNVCAII